MDPVFGGIAMGASYAHSMYRRIVKITLGSLALLGIAGFAVYKEIPQELSDVKVTETGIEYTEKTPMNDCSNFGFSLDDEGCEPYIKVQGLEECLVGTDLDMLKKGDVLKSITYKKGFGQCYQVLVYER